MIDLATARETFEASTDGTVGIEEEFALLDPGTHELVPRFELLRDAAQGDPVLTESIAGELISSEIEIRSGRGEDAADARARQARPPPAPVHARGRPRRRARHRPARTRSATTRTSTSSTPITTTGSRTA